MNVCRPLPVACLSETCQHLSQLLHSVCCSFCPKGRGQRFGAGVDRVLGARIQSGEGSGPRQESGAGSNLLVRCCSTACGKLQLLWIRGGHTCRSAAPMKARVHSVSAVCVVRFCYESTTYLGILRWRRQVPPSGSRYSLVVRDLVVRSRQRLVPKKVVSWLPWLCGFSW